MVQRQHSVDRSTLLHIQILSNPFLLDYSPKDRETLLDFSEVALILGTKYDYQSHPTFWCNSLIIIVFHRKSLKKNWSLPLISFSQGNLFSFYSDTHDLIVSTKFCKDAARLEVLISKAYFWCLEHFYWTFSRSYENENLEL